MAIKKPENMTFEAALSELTEIVTQMEQNELSLEDSLKQFERGVQLARSSQEKLNDAEQKVSILLQNNEEQTLQPFTQDSNG